MRLPFALAIILCGCGGARRSDVLSTPDADVELVTMTGRVTDVSLLPLEGAQVWCAECDTFSTTDADGRYTLSVPADSTVTLRALLLNYTSTTLEPVFLTGTAARTGLDLVMLSGSTLGAFNQLAGPSEERGVIAVNLVSLSGSCTPEGGVVSLDPIPAAKSIYVRDGDHRPDPSLTAMQAHGSPHAWVVGVPPGTGYTLQFHKAGCRSLSLPVRWNGAQWLEGLRITKSLTQAYVFTE